MPSFVSTAISRAEYDDTSRVLQLWFAETGGPYDFYGVPRAIFDGLCRVASKGSYYNTYIRDRYSSRR